MPVWYVDTSAFLKLLVAEEHSTAFRQQVADTALWSSSLLAVEAHRAGPRLGIHASSVDDALATVTMVIPNESTYNSAQRVGLPELRTLDALHLAAALELGADLAGLLTYDRRLAAGAEHESVVVSSPGLPLHWWR
jgi:uncharacterized protein